MRSKRDIQFLEESLLSALKVAAEYVYVAGQNATVLGMEISDLLREYNRLVSGHKVMSERIDAIREERNTAQWGDNGAWTEDGSDGQGN